MNLLIPLDGSTLAEAALVYGERLGKALGWGAVLLMVLPHDPGEASDLEVDPSDLETAAVVDSATAESAAEVVRHRRARAQERLGPPAARLRAAGLTVETQVSFGKAREAIVDRAGADDVGLIVMASHGRTGLARLFRGSVAAGVVAHASRPVLVVRPFQDAAPRVHLEHPERLPPAQAEAVRGALAVIGP